MPENITSKTQSVRRLGFGPYIEGLDQALQGGVPEGSWISLYGPPGSLKTLHALAFCINALNSKERCIYISTEMDVYQIRRQVESLGWSFGKAYSTIFTSKIVEDKDYGSYELVLADIDSLRYWALRLNREVVAEEAKGKKKTYFWYADPMLLTHLVLVSLGAVGVLERKAKDITIDEVMYARVKDGLRESKYAKFSVNEDVHCRVVIDSLSIFTSARGPSVAGRILTDMKIRLAAPSITYLITNHVAKTTEEELGAQIGHIVDGRIKLWKDVNKENVLEYYGLVDKMRETDHSRKVHMISIKQSGNTKYLHWIA